MSHTLPSPRRRTVLTTIATGGFVSVAGCTTGESSDPGSGALTAVTVEGTELAVEYDAETTASGLAVIAPSGEAFAERDLTPGASRETIPLGTAYPPGTYIVQLVDGDSVVAAVEQSLRPDVVIRELKLARNHPDEMYEGAASLTITGEVIVDVENVGTGPEKLTKLQFNGDVPQPTSDELSESGIAAVEKPVTYTEPVLGSGERRTVYSRTLPFGPRSEQINCTPDGTSGRFEVSLTGNVGGKLAEKEYNVTYQGENLSECQITIERVDT